MDARTEEAHFSVKAESKRAKKYPVDLQLGRGIFYHLQHAKRTHVRAAIGAGNKAEYNVGLGHIRVGGVRCKV